jgi:2-polyprenyl-3-methyl-5-hydroxy-6-metoxy-1,4-benzoquinol methylase
MKNFCPICNSKNLEIIIKRLNTPINQNLYFNSTQESLRALKGNLTLTICNDCNFIFNNSFEPEKLIYNDNYDNSQNFSSFFKSYTDDLISEISNEFTNHNKTIVEIGCGKGDFIKSLMMKYSDKNNIKAYGFDTSYVGEKEFFDNKLVFYRDYYDSKYSDIKADILICRHVIEHIHNPINFFKEIYQCLNDNGVVFFETPCVDWILENKVYFDIFYEHCSYFNKNSISKVLQESNLSIENIKNVFGGQYLWVKAKKFKDLNIKYLDIKPDINLINDFKKNESYFVNNWKKNLLDMKKEGNIALWGAGAKGVTFSNLFDPNHKLIDYIIDINPQKQNKFISCTGHKIISPQNLLEINLKYVIIMNPNYYNEIKTILEYNEEKIELFNI